MCWPAVMESQCDSRASHLLAGGPLTRRKRSSAYVSQPCLSLLTTKLCDGSEHKQAVQAQYSRAAHWGGEGGVHLARTGESSSSRDQRRSWIPHLQFPPPRFPWTVTPQSGLGPLTRIAGEVPMSHDPRRSRTALVNAGRIQRQWGGRGANSYPRSACGHVRSPEAHTQQQQGWMDTCVVRRFSRRIELVHVEHMHVVARVQPNLSSRGYLAAHSAAGG